MAYRNKYVFLAGSFFLTPRNLEEVSWFRGLRTRLYQYWSPDGLGRYFYGWAFWQLFIRDHSCTWLSKRKWLIGWMDNEAPSLDEWINEFLAFSNLYNFNRECLIVNPAFLRYAFVAKVDLYSNQKLSVNSINLLSMAYLSSNNRPIIFNQKIYSELINSSKSSALPQLDSSNAA